MVPGQRGQCPESAGRRRDKGILGIRGNTAGNVAIMTRMLVAIDALASLTVSTSHLRALDEQVQCIAELADRSIESTHDRARSAGI